MIIGGGQDLERWRDQSPRIFVEWELRAVEDRAETERQGRIVYRDEEWGNIHKKGELGHVIPYRVKDLKRNSVLWPHISNSYEAWKAGLDAPIEGTPLKEWPLITAAQLRNCTGMNVLSVEDLANLADGAMRFIGGEAVALREKARNWLNAASDVGKAAATITRLEEENQKLMMMVRKLTEDVEAMRGEIKPKAEAPVMQQFDVATKRAR
jgi:hypothetical protein